MSLSHKPIASIIIPTGNNFAFLEKALLSLKGQDCQDFEIIVVDNASSDKSALYAASKLLPNLRCVELNRNAFFCEGVNIGIEEAKGEYIAVVNDDTEFNSDWLSKSLETFSLNPAIGSVAPKILYMRDKKLIDSIGNHLMPNGLAANIGWQEMDTGQYNKTEQVFSCCAAGAIYKKSALQDVGGFDNFLIAYYEDIDLGYRLNLAGYYCFYNPQAIMYHYRGASLRNVYRAIELVERNILINLLKNTPAPLIYKYIYEITKSALHPIEFVIGDNSRVKSFRSWFRGKTKFLISLPYVFQKRRATQKIMRVDIGYIDKLLNRIKLTALHL